MSTQKKRRGKRAIEDPHARREASRYEHPIPSREAILAMLNEHGELMKEGRIAEVLGLSLDRDREALRRRLTAMIKAGQLIKNRREGYGIAQKLDLEPGRVIGHPDGYGFVSPD
ncbi:MAG: ribonuclease R, partial [Pseudomonadota bacterium]